MSWYVHPSKQLRDDELPPELVVTNRDGSVEQVYVPYNASDQLEAENAKLRELAVLNWEWAHSCCGNNCKMQTDGCGYQIDRECNYEREIYDRMREMGVEVDG